MKPDSNLSDSTATKRSLLTTLVRFLLPIIVLAVGVLIFNHLLKTKPKAKPRVKPVHETIVQVSTVSFKPEQTSITAMGSVVAAREIDLKPRVSGEILSMDKSMVPGGYLEKGRNILKIDAADYELTEMQLESDVAMAKSNLAIEMGRQLVAKKEFELLGETATDEEIKLMLRTPQLNNQKATLKAAEAKLKKAKLDLTRTRLKSPFNAVVRSRNVNVGTRVSSSSVLASLVGTDMFWVELALPVEQLKWLIFPQDNSSEKGALVHIYPQSAGNSDTYRTGYVVRLAAELEERGRMARIFVEVEDPLCLKAENKSLPPLFLGSFVRAEITGTTMNSAFSLQRSHLRDGNTVWLLGNDGTLDIKTVSIAFRDKETVLVSDGVADGDKLIISNISAPVAGMRLRLEGDKPRKSPKKKEGAKPRDQAMKQGSKSRE